MANGTPAPQASQRTGRNGGSPSNLPDADGVQAKPFNADNRTAVREDTPVVIDGVSYTRARKNWKVSRMMRKLMRDQESAIALSTRLRRRIVELEVEQMQAAANGAEDDEAKLEGQITELIAKADEATEVAEGVTYRLLCVLLKHADEQLLDENGEPLPARVEKFMDVLDVEDAADLARELSGSSEEDPPTPQETATTSA